MESKQLKDAAKELNGLGLEGIEKLRTVGVKQAALEDAFLTAVEAVDDAGLSESLTEGIIAVYNELSAATEEGTPAAETPEAEKPVEEKPGKKTKKTEKSQKKAADKGRGANKGASRSRYGHVQSALSGKLDDCMFSGMTVQAMMDELNIKRTRVVNHAKHLKNDKSLTVVETKPEGKDVKLNDTHIQVTEEVWTAD